MPALDALRLPSATLLSNLRGAEGLELVAYPDPQSALGRALAARHKLMREYRSLDGWRGLSGVPWTIAYGRAGRCKEGDTCTRAEAAAWLVEDAADAIRTLLEKLPWTASLDPVRFDVMAELMFNMGWRRVDKAGAAHGLSTFTRTLGLIEDRHFDAAADALSASIWAKQVGRRATRMIAALRTGKA